MDEETREVGRRKLRAQRLAKARVTPQASDIRLHTKYKAMGAGACERCEARRPPFDPRSLIAQWWYEGYDEAVRSWRARNKT
jgi:hypothetical protein